VEPSANLEGSRVLVHQGHGHGLMNHSSKCTFQAIRDYFKDMRLLEVGKVYEPDREA
jgi:hypothetical protein